MNEEEFNKLTPEDKKNLKEMLAFWTWIRGLNKLAKWIVFIGAPISISIWAFYRWIKGY